MQTCWLTDAATGYINIRLLITRLYAQDHNAGNGYKVKLLLEQLRQPFQWVNVDILQAAKSHTRVPEEEPQRHDTAT